MSGISSVTSWRLPPVSAQASGIPVASTRRWCFEPFLALSAGLGAPLSLPGARAGSVPFEPLFRSAIESTRRTRSKASFVRPWRMRSSATSESAREPLVLSVEAAELMIPFHLSSTEPLSSSVALELQRVAEEE